MTPEREYFNITVLPKFIKDYVTKGDAVIDIGKPNDGWGYRKMFEDVGAIYKTLDRRRDLNPDIWCDVEEVQLRKEIADCIICNGVTEQCNNPFKLVDGIKEILKIGGFGLFGIMATSFPLIQDLDLWRFTPQGIGKLLNKFCLVDFDASQNRRGISSYIFVIVKREV